MGGAWVKEPNSTPASPENTHVWFPGDLERNSCLETVFNFECLFPLKWEEYNPITQTGCFINGISKLVLLIFTNRCVFTDVGVDIPNNVIPLQKKLLKPQRCLND